MLKKIVSVLVTVILLLGTYYIHSYKNVAAIDNSDNIRACWISYLDIQTYLKDLSREEFEIKVSDMYKRIKDNNLNTVIVQVRAMADAIYPSEYFPWSIYISSDRTPLSYDPLEIMIELAQKENLRFEAWINPYRVSMSNTTTNSFENTSFYHDYKDFIMEYENPSGEICLSFDPSKTETIRLIVSGVKEIVQNYDVDGIHFDDYFYVSGMSPELSADKRKEYVNNMVKTIYDTIKSIDEDCEFGISPAGNIENARAEGADIDKWLSTPGYIDYIMPQIYWTDNYVTTEGEITYFSKRCDEWNRINTLNLPMYLGMGLYRVGEESSIDLGWSADNDNLASQYKKSSLMGFDGYAVFRYQWLELDVAEDELYNLKKSVELELSYPYVKDSYISYSIKNVEDWETAKIDGISAGNGSEIFGIVFSPGDKAPEGHISYRVMYQDGTWSDWCSEGVLCEGKNSILNLQICLSGEIGNTYDIYYRCCLTNIGWLPWVKNGMDVNSGVINEKMTGIQVKLVKK